MKGKYLIFMAFITALLSGSCSTDEKNPDMKIVFLHHSTGGVIWDGDGTYHQNVKSLWMAICLHFLKSLTRIMERITG
jgi:hypothetical protein